MVFWQALAPNPIEGMLSVLYVITPYNFSMLLDSAVNVCSLFPSSSTAMEEFEISSIHHGAQ